MQIGLSGVTASIKRRVFWAGTMAGRRTLRAL